MWIVAPSSRAPLNAISRPLRRTVSMALVLFSLSWAAWAAEGPVVPVTASPGVTAEPLVVPRGERLDLSLDQALLFALQHNTSIVVQRYQRSRALLDIDVERGLFDFNLEGEAGLNSSSRPSNSALEDADVVSADTDTLNLRLLRNLPWGGGFSVGFANQRAESSDANVQPNPRFNLGLTFAYLQPLLRNFGRDITRRNIWVATNNSKIDRENFRLLIEDIIQQVSNSYWDLVGNRQQLAVSEESLQLAKNLHEMNRIQVDVGTKAPLELVQSEVGVALREEEIIRRRAAVEDSEDNLRFLMNLAQTELWDMPIVPITEAEMPHQPVDLAAAVATAREKRADIIQQQLINEQRAYDYRVAVNQVKPRLDLQASYGYSAIAGRLESVDPTTGQPILIDDGYVDALDQLAGRDYDAWSLQLNLSMPIQNTTARARRAQAELELDRGDLELRDRMDRALLEVRRSARLVETAAQAIELAEVSSTLARRNLEAEQKRYENGLSTSFQVLEIQEDLSIALSSQVNAVIVYRKAVVALDRATGELLENTGVTLGDEEDPDF